MRVILGKKKENNDSAKVALPIFIDEYTKECDRKTTIENKVISLVTIEIAILTGVSQSLCKPESVILFL